MKKKTDAWFTPPENWQRVKTTENWWLEDKPFLFGNGPFSADIRSFSGGSLWKKSINWFWQSPNQQKERPVSSQIFPPNLQLCQSLISCKSSLIYMAWGLDSWCQCIFKQIIPGAKKKSRLKSFQKSIAKITWSKYKFPCETLWTSKMWMPTWMKLLWTKIQLHLLEKPSQIWWHPLRRSWPGKLES